ncbi:hypothetical protein [Virgibacillus kimchii]
MRNTADFIFFMTKVLLGGFGKLHNVERIMEDWGLFVLQVILRGDEELVLGRTAGYFTRKWELWHNPHIAA